MIDANIPLQGQQIDTASGIYDMQNQQNQNAIATQQVLGQYYQNLEAREQSRLQSTIAGAAQLKQFLDNNDLQGAENYLQSRRTNLVGRIGAGEAIDTEDTDAALQMLRQGNIDELQNNINGLLAAGQVYGIIDPVSNAGGNTGVLVDRLIKEGSARNVSEALQLIKGGAGQMGRNMADIGTGAQANYATQSGTNQSNLEYAPQIAQATTVATNRADQQSADNTAAPILQQMIKINQDTFDAPYAGAIQGPAKIAGFEKQTTAFDLLKQSRLELAAPLAKQLGVNPTDKDFQASLDRIVDTNSTKASRKAQLQQLLNRIQQRQGQAGPQQQVGQQQAPANQRVRVMNPQTGEMLEIDASDLPAAQAEGFQQQ